MEGEQKEHSTYTQEYLNSLVEIAKNNPKELPAVFFQCRKFIVKQASRWWNLCGSRCRCEMEDLIQSSYFAVHDAVDSYRADAGKGFLGWLDFYLRREFQRTAGFNRAKGKQSAFDNRALSMDDDISDDIRLEDTIADPVNCIEEVEEKIFQKQLHEAFDEYFNQILSQDNADLCRMRFFGEQSPSEIAKKTGLKEKQIQNRIDKSYKELVRNSHGPYAEKLLDLASNIINPYRMIGVTRFQTTRTSIEEDILLFKEHMEEASMYDDYDNDFHCWASDRMPSIPKAK